MSTEFPPHPTQPSALSAQHFAGAIWRLILPEALDGPENMAVDEALLASVGEGTAPPTLRFYEWHSPWISLGTGQQAGDLDAAALDARGWGTLRRSSGGTAVLHQGQLGYALVLPAGHPLWEGDLAASYRRLAEPLALAFNRLGVRAEPAPASLKARFSAGAPPLAARICFSALGPYELLDQTGRKIIGNAQVRRRAAALQHGTIQLFGNQTDLVDVLANATADERRDLVCYLSTHVGSLEDSSGHRFSAMKLATAIAEAFEDTLGVRFSLGTLNETECCQARALARSTYRNPDWTFRR